MSTHKLNIKFYQNLAKVFYAIANAERKLNNKDLKFLKTTIKKEWLEIDEIIDAFRADTAYQMEIVIDWLHSKKATFKDCFEDFIEYYHNHIHLFSDKIKELIMLTALKLSPQSIDNKPKLINFLKLEFDKKTSNHNN